MIYSRIAVPLDGSESSEAGLREAIKIAQDRSRRILLIHVIEKLYRHEQFDPETVGAVILKAWRQEGEDLLRQARERLAQADIPADEKLIITEGRISEAIVAQAESWKAELIVMGTHGRRGVRRMVLGSDAADIVRTSRVPVLLVGAGTSA